MGDLKKESIRQKINSFPRWHYEFDLKGIKTPAFPRYNVIRHPLRREHIFPKLLEMYGGSFSGKRILDLGCNAGWWSIEAIKKGADFVLGIDARDMHIEQARFVASVYGIKNAEFKKMNVFDVSLDTVGEFDICFCLGLLYHVNKPLYLLEKIYEVTKETAVIDTKAQPVLLSKVKNRFFFNFNVIKRFVSFLLGRRRYAPLLSGAYVRLRHEEATDPRSTHKAGVVWLPTLEATTMMLRDVGFKNITVLENKGKLPKDYLENRRFSIIARK